MRSNPIRAILTIVSLFAVASVSTAATVDKKRLRYDVKHLSDDSYLGREAGEPGTHRAEEYIARRFMQLGLAPLPGEKDYFLEFDLFRSGIDRDGTQLTVTLGGEPASAAVGKNFRPFPFSAEGSAKAPLVFAGYGITAEEHEYDDYEGLDVEGKFVLILRHEPREQDPDSSFDGTETTEHATFASKAENARNHGARGMLLVTDPLHHPPSDDLRVRAGLRLEKEQPQRRAGDADPEEAFLAVQIDQPLARRIVEASGHDLEALQRAMDEGRAPGEFPLGDAAAELAVALADEVERVPARNVAAFLEGSDPELRDEWIVVGGHHDHVGGYEGEGDTVFNGADDNASGTSGVMELARIFAARETPPRRSMAFVTFAAEEKGLLGSRAMVEQAQLPVEKLRFMFNLDMIGRNPDQDVQLFGDGYVRGLKELVDAANAGTELPIAYAGDRYAGNSDHDPFYDRGVPFMFFFTGIHEDYHQLGDHANKIDYKRMASILEVAAGVLESIADAPTAPAFIHHVTWLGLRFEERDGGAVITAVDDESRAADAGIAVGDRLRGVDGESLSAASAVAAAFREIEPGEKAELMLAREGAGRSVSVERARVGYMGVIPGAPSDEQRQALGLAHDEGILLRQVVPEGPAASGGLENGDILIRVDGRAIGVATLGRRMQQIGAGETVEMTVIRGDERKTLSVELGERPTRRR